MMDVAQRHGPTRRDAPRCPVGSTLQATVPASLLMHDAVPMGVRITRRLGRSATNVADATDSVPAHPTGSVKAVAALASTFVAPLLTWP